jgi:hypothetical protein
MAVISQRNNFRLGFWAFTLMEESSEPCATLSRKISGSRIHRTAGGAPIARRLIWPQMNTDFSFACLSTLNFQPSTKLLPLPNFLRTLAAWQILATNQEKVF